MNDKKPGPDAQWGLCIECAWWQVEPYEPLEQCTHGMCIEQTLQPYSLRVSGNSGCDLFIQGEPARAEGSGTCPPEAEPTR